MNGLHAFLTVGEVSKAVDGIVQGDADQKLFKLMFPSDATEDGLVICLEDMRRDSAIMAKAGAVLLPLTLGLPTNKTFIMTTMNMRDALFRVIRLFKEYGLLSKSYEAKPILHDTVIVGANVSIGKGTKVGAHTVIDDHVIIGQGVTIGENCKIEPGVILRDGVYLGNNSIIHSGTVIGGEGFMFSDEEGARLRIPSIGSVVIENHVEIFENTTIARGILGNTTIGYGTKLDCQTHIGHDVIIGHRCRVCARCSIAGWAELQDDVTLYGMCGVGNHVVVGKGATVYAASAVTKNIHPYTVVSGNPAMNHHEELKRNAFFRRFYKNQKG